MTDQEKIKELQAANARLIKRIERMEDILKAYLRGFSPRFGDVREVIDGSHR